MAHTNSYKKYSTPAIIVLIAVLAAAVALYQKTPFHKGDHVLSQADRNMWYMGVVTNPCKDGYNISFNDGRSRCMKPEDILLDQIPSKNDLHIGSKIVTPWKADIYYDAKITDLAGQQYKIEYYDLVTNVVNREEIRVAK